MRVWAGSGYRRGHLGLASAAPAAPERLDSAGNRERGRLRRLRHGRSHAGLGFTLMEVLVALVVGTLIVGGVMGVLGASMQYRKRVVDKIADWPLLEAAAQRILLEPEAFVDGDVVLADLPGEPVVRAAWTRVELLAGGLEETEELARKALYRVELHYGKSRLQLSVVRGGRHEP